MKLYLSSAYLPNIEYIAHIKNCDTVFIESEESYLKQTYRNRCQILTANGVQAISIPVTKVNGNNTKTKDIEISYSCDWQRVHWGAITSAYNSSPYFMYYKELFMPLYDNRTCINLLDFNSQLLKIILQILGIKKELFFTNEFIKECDGIDLRYSISPKHDSMMRRFAEYDQVYGHKFPFQSNLSAIDLIFNLGPEAKLYLNSMKDV